MKDYLTEQGGAANEVNEDKLQNVLIKFINEKEALQTIIEKACELYVGTNRDEIVKCIVK